MRTSLRTAALAAGLLSIPGGVVAAQATLTDADRAAIATLSSDLRNLVTRQEAWYAEKNSYALAFAELASSYRTSAGVMIELASATKNSYGAIARLAGRAGSCVIFVGLGTEGAPRTDVEKKLSPEGEPACDGDGISERAAFARDAEAGAAAALVRLAKLEERHFGRTGVYATDVSALTGLRVPATVSFTIELAPAANQEMAMLAIASDSRYPGFTCVLRSGFGRFGVRARTAVEKKWPTADLMPVCDTFK